MNDASTKKNQGTAIITLVRLLVASIVLLALGIVASVSWTGNREAHLERVIENHLAPALGHAERIRAHLDEYQHATMRRRDARGAASLSKGALQESLAEEAKRLVELQTEFADPRFVAATERLRTEVTRLPDRLDTRSDRLTGSQLVPESVFPLFIATEQLRRLYEGAREEIAAELVIAKRAHRQHLLAIVATLTLLGLLTVPKIFQQIRSVLAAQQETSRRLEASESRLRSIVEHSPSPIYLADADLRLLQVNPQYARERGRPADALLGTRIRARSDGNDELHHPQLEALVLEQQRSITRETIQPDGSDRRIYLTTEFPIFDDAGEVVGVGGIATDISERRKAEQALARLNDELETRVEQRTEALTQAQEALLRGERLSTLGQLTAMVSHELRNPLGTIRSSMYTVRQRAPDADERLRAAFDRIERSIERCDRIINELLDYTRAAPMNRVDADFDAWLSRTLDEFERPPGLVVERRLGLGTLAVSFDPDRMHRVVVNLWDNACQALAESAPDEARLRVETRRVGERVEMSFSDNGPGIPDDRRDRIFEPLFSTKGFGVGLGLPIVAQIMERHGGGVDARVPGDAGASMVTWLPIEAPAT